MDDIKLINVKIIPSLGQIDWLLAYDASESSLQAFQWILRHMKSHEKLQVLRIIKKDKDEDVKSDLDALKREANYLGFNNVDYVILSGDPKTRIHDVAEKSNPVHVVMGSRGHSRMRRFFLGSTSDYIVGNTNLTTVIVPHHDDVNKKSKHVTEDAGNDTAITKSTTTTTTTPPTKWMVCVDGSDASYLALQWALDHISNKKNDDLYLASVIQDEHSAYEINHNKSREHKSIVMENHTKLISRCKMEVKRYGMTPLLLEREGNARETLQEWITTYEIDNLVVGRRGMSSTKRLFVGSTSKYLASAGLCNVIVVKSDPDVPCCPSPVIPPRSL